MAITANDLKAAISGSSIGNIAQPSAPVSPQAQGNLVQNYSFDDAIKELKTAYGTAGERNEARWKMATQLADMDQTVRTDADRRRMQDTYFNMLEPEDGVTAGDYRYDNPLMDIADAVGGALDSAYLAGGDFLDAVVLDGLIAGGADFLGAKDFANDVRNATTGEDLAWIPEVASDFALAAIPGVGWGTLAAKGAIDSRDQIHAAITGIDRNTGEKLGDTNRLLNAGAGLLSIGLPIGVGKGVAKAASKDIAESAAGAATKARKNVDKLDFEESAGRLTNAYENYEKSLAKNGNLNGADAIRARQTVDKVNSDLPGLNQSLDNARAAHLANPSSGNRDALVNARSAVDQATQQLDDANDVLKRYGKIKNTKDNFDNSLSRHAKVQAKYDEAQPILEQALENVASSQRLLQNGPGFLPDPNLLRMGAGRMSDDIAARAAAAQAAGGPLSAVRQFLKSPNAAKAAEEAVEEGAEKGAKKGAKKAAKSSKEELLPEEQLLKTIEDQAKSSGEKTSKSLLKRYGDRKEAAKEFTGSGPFVGALSNLGVGGLNLAAATGGNDLPEIQAGLGELYASQHPYEVALKALTMLPIRNTKAISRRFGGNQNPYWARRANMTSALTEDPLGARALPTTEGNSQLEQLLQSMYEEPEE